MDICSFAFVWALSGPEVGYIIKDDVVSKVNFLKLIWRPNNRGYMQLCLCPWARRWDIFKYRRCFGQSQFSKNDLEAKQSWIYAVLLLPLGPVGPGGGIYSIIDYVVCKVYFLMDQVDHVIC